MLIIDIQDTLILTVNQTLAKWAHRPASAWAPGGHAGRTIHAAKRKARAQLAKCSYDAIQIEALIKDALEIAELQRLAQDE